MQLLGLDESWQVEKVNLQVADKYVEITTVPTLEFEIHLT